MHEAERGLSDLQQGRPLYITAPDADGAPGALAAAVEGARRGTLGRLGRLTGEPVRLGVTGHRARAMGLSNGGRPVPLSLPLPAAAAPDDILRLATTLAAPGALGDVREASAAELGALTLTRLARLIPAVVAAPVGPAEPPALRHSLERGAILHVTTAQIDLLAASTRLELTYVSDGPVPLEDAEDASFICFREANGILEHVAVVIGDRGRWPDPVPVRIHSACLTGDLFGSLRCDCGEQLRRSLRIFAASGGGVLLYLAQEGRGIGLGNKLRAYTLQQQGLDTVDADCMLGFGADERLYDAAIEMLRHLRIDRVRLLTNNPEKVRALQEAGIDVVKREALYGTLNRHNVAYVKAKVSRAGHWLGELLAGTANGNGR